MDPHKDRAGREAKFRALFDSSYPALLRFVQRRVHPSHAEDVVADTFMVAWRRLDQVPTDPDPARAWLFQVARRNLLNNQRGKKRQHALATRIAETAKLQASGPAAFASDETDAAHRRMELATAWPQLSRTDQEALALVAWDGLSTSEAAEVLSISNVAFRLRLSRGRRALRRLLEDPAPRARTPRLSPSNASEGQSR